MTAAGGGPLAHDSLVDQVKAALATAPARSRVATPSPPRDGRGRYAAAKAADVLSDTPERDG